MISFRHLRLARVDDFISELWDVHLKVQAEGFVQVSLLLMTKSGPYQTFPGCFSRNFQIRLYDAQEWRTR